MPKKQIILLAVTVSFILNLFFLYPFYLNLSKPIIIRGDNLYNYFLQDNNLTKLSQADFKNLYNTKMFYPIKNTLALGNSHLTNSAIGLPIYLLTGNLFITAHFIVLFAFFISFLSMFALAYFLSKNIGGSLIAGLVYSYNPFIMAHVQHYEAFSLQWLPLIFLSLIKLTEKASLKWGLIFILAFISQLMSSFYYTFFIVIIAPFFILGLIFIKKFSYKRFIQPIFLGCLVITALISILFLQPFFLSKKVYKPQRSLDINIALSTHLSDFLFTSPQNKTYGILSNTPIWSIRDPYVAIHYTEHSLFPGLIVYLLLMCLIFLLFKNKFLKEDSNWIKIFGLIFLICFIFSFGPYIVLGNLQIPLPYLLTYDFVPFSSALRAPSRFMVVGFLALSLLLAFAWKRLSGLLKKYQKLGISLIIILICLEYQTTITGFSILNPDIENFTSWLKTQQDINAVINLPIANSFGSSDEKRDFADDSIYMFYSIYHGKNIVNGYTSYIPPQAKLRGDRLTVDFLDPLNVNNLKSNKINLLVIFLDEYTNRQTGEVLIEKLSQERNFLKVYDSKNIKAFKLKL